MTALLAPNLEGGAIEDRDPQSNSEAAMDATTLLIIIIVLIVLGGGGWYGRGRWY